MLRHCSIGSSKFDQFISKSQWYIIIILECSADNDVIGFLLSVMTYSDEGNYEGGINDSHSHYPAATYSVMFAINSLSSGCFGFKLRQCLFCINTVNIHKRWWDNIKVVTYCYAVHTILIVNIAEYLYMETSSKVSSELLSSKPPWWEVKVKAGTSCKLCGERCGGLVFIYTSIQEYFINAWYSDHSNEI